jgi:hypothetical protein
MNAHEHKRRLNRVWTWPMAIALVTAVGLISALLGDGWADAGAWVGMGLPIFVAIVCVLRAGSPKR